MSHPVSDSAARPELGKASLLKTVVVSLMIMLAGVVAIWLIFKTEPKATRNKVARETAMLVDVQTVQRGQFTPTIEVMGRVVPAREITLGSRVSGEVVEQSSTFNPGSHVDSGQTLLRLDAADYQAVLQQRRSELQQAQADLALEQGQQVIAQREFELLGDDIEQVDRALILRQPQLEQAKARVAVAKSALQRAELDIARTTIRAPFAAQVLSREVTLGSQVAAGQPLGRLVGTEQYWVEATVPLAKLRWLAFNPDNSARASLHHDAVWPAGQVRHGRLARLIGELDNSARMARVLITVEDPLALKQAAGKPALMLGTIVRAEIEGLPLDNVVRLARQLVRRNNTVWVMEDQQLAIRDVDIVFRDEHHVYISSGLETGDSVITNDLASVVPGARLRLEGDAP